MEKVPTAWDNYLLSAADLFSSAHSRSLQAANANKLLESRKVLESAISAAEFELILIQRWLDTKESLEINLPEKQSQLPDAQPEAEKLEEAQPVESTVVPETNRTLMTDLLMEFDMDSNF